MTPKQQAMLECHGLHSRPYRSETENALKHTFKTPKECWEFEQDEFENVPEMYGVEEKNYTKPRGPIPEFPEHDEFEFPQGSEYRQRLEEVRHRRRLAYCENEERYDLRQEEALRRLRIKSLMR